jgi:serine/threonine protein phosphatase 1
MYHSKISQNFSGRDFVVTDINGCFNELMRLTSSVGFSDSDRLFMLGNSINRGLQAKEVIEFTKNENVYPLLGNDEFYMLMSLSPGMPNDEREVFLSQWDANGGEWRKSATPVQLNELYKQVLKWPLTYTVDGLRRVGLVHSEVPFNSWSEFVGSTVDYGIIQRATTGQTVLQGPRDGMIGDIDFVLSGHFQIPKPPRLIGNSFFLNSGIIVGRPGIIYDVSDFQVP